MPWSLKNVIVLMLENRSFDHFLGWLPNPDSNGLTGSEFNYMDVGTKDRSIAVGNGDSPDRTRHDPCHGFDCNMFQMFAPEQWPKVEYKTNPAGNAGFVQQDFLAGGDGYHPHRDLWIRELYMYPILSHCKSVCHRFFPQR